MSAADTGPGTTAAQAVAPDAPLPEPVAAAIGCSRSAFLRPPRSSSRVWSSTRRSTPIWRSFYDRSGRNVRRARQLPRRCSASDTIRTAIKNNALWVAVVPALVTAIGLIFAVLTERIRWSVAFKTVVFMPMAISLFAAGVIWRLVYEQDPDRGALNAAIAVVHDTFEPTGVLAQAPAVAAGRRSSSAATAASILKQPRAGRRRRRCSA